MKKKFEILLILIFIIIILVACQTDESSYKTEEEVDKVQEDTFDIHKDYEGTLLKYYGGWKDNKANGYGISFDDDHYISYVGEWLNDSYYGKGRKYYINGRLKFDGMFENNELSGYGIGYYENGNILYDGESDNGLPDGIGIVYYENGSIAYEGYLSNGEPNGEGILYYKNGEIEFDGEFQNGSYSYGTHYYREPSRFKYEIHKGNFKNNLLDGNGLKVLLTNEGFYVYEGIYSNGDMKEVSYREAVESDGVYYIYDKYMEMVGEGIEGYVNGFMSFEEFKGDAYCKIFYLRPNNQYVLLNKRVNVFNDNTLYTMFYEENNYDIYDVIMELLKSPGTDFEELESGIYKKVNNSITLYDFHGEKEIYGYIVDNSYLDLDNTKFYMLDQFRGKSNNVNYDENNVDNADDKNSYFEEVKDGELLSFVSKEIKKVNSKNEADELVDKLLEEQKIFERDFDERLMKFRESISNYSIEEINNNPDSIKEQDFKKLILEIHNTGYMVSYSDIYPAVFTNYAEINEKYNKYITEELSSYLEILALYTGKNIWDDEDKLKNKMGKIEDFIVQFPFSKYLDELVFKHSSLNNNLISLDDENSGY